MSWSKHEVFEKNSIVLTVGILIAVAIGGIIEIVPLFYLKSTIENVKGVRPYTPLELAGRNIYIREGCYLCHSQMIRPLRDEVERYGPYSLAAESMYDHGFQWGSKRTGPDLARVGNKYSDKWHVEHMKDPRSVVPASVMPGYPFLATTDLKIKYLADHLKTNRMIGVPYTDDMIKNAVADARAQAGDPDSDEAEGLTARYGVEDKSWKVTIRDFDGNPERLTELDALIAYLQVLGTMVDFSLYKDKAPTEWLR